MTGEDVYDEWKDTPDFSAWPEIKDEPSFDWSQSLEVIEKKYKVKTRDDFDTGWGNSFAMLVRNYHKEEKKKQRRIKKIPKELGFDNVKPKREIPPVSEETRQEVKRLVSKFDFETPKNNIDATFVNFHYDDL